jgi:hypothetical protein
MQFLDIYWTKDSNLLIYAIHSLSQWCKSMIFWCRFGSESGSSVYEGRKPETGTTISQKTRVFCSMLFTVLSTGGFQKNHSLFWDAILGHLLNKRLESFDLCYSQSLSVMQIHDILVSIRIRIRGTGSADPCLWLMDPDSDPVPSIFIIDLQDANRN